MNLTDATDIVFWDVPAPCSHSCPFLDLDLHASGGGGLMRGKQTVTDRIGARRYGQQCTGQRLVLALLVYNGGVWW